MVAAKITASRGFFYINLASLAFLVFLLLQPRSLFFISPCLLFCLLFLFLLLCLLILHHRAETEDVVVGVSFRWSGGESKELSITFVERKTSRAPHETHYRQ